MKIFRFLIAICCAITGLHAQTYSLTNLGDLGGTYSSATAISAGGSVVGFADTAANNVGHAVLFNGKGIGNSDLGAIGGLDGSANGINASGVIVGRSSPEFNNFYRATRFNGNGAGNSDLGTLGGPSSTALAINTSGVVVGDAARSDGFFHATRFDDSENFDLGTLGGLTSAARAVNLAGTIVGSADLSNGKTRAVRFSGTGTNNKDLGTLGGTTSVANGINASGIIVGTAETKQSRINHATRFSGTGTGNTDLGTLGGFQSYAYAVNASGIIVGQSMIPLDDGGGFHAFIYRKGKMEDLNDLIPRRADLILTDARAINDKGQIAANGTLNGVVRAFLLEPADLTPSFKISVSARPAAKGSVKGAGSYKEGRKINLTATPKNGAVFVKWTENGKSVSTNKVYSFKVTKSRTFVAHFR